MTSIEVARGLTRLGHSDEARMAYELALKESTEPEELYEAAGSVFFSGGDYKLPYEIFRQLYNEGFNTEELFSIMSEAFYDPNVRRQRLLYNENCRALEKYPYIFRKDFPDFEQLPVKFFPYDDNGFFPFYTSEKRFGEYMEPEKPVISRNFFKDLDKPIKAEDIYSQYELEYLNDNVRKSEWCAKENHIYLHYTDFGEFCSWLQVLDFKKFLRDKKFVILIGGEIEQYPIDFKERFNIDYTKYQVKPFEVDEVKRLIFHVQLSTHNGGDYFNEVFYGHPNLIIYDSFMYDSMVEIIKAMRELLKRGNYSGREWEGIADNLMIDVVSLRKFAFRRKYTDSELMIALFMWNRINSKNLDPSSRIAPVFFSQLHFINIYYQYEKGQNGVRVWSDELEKVLASPLYTGFKYVKTFAPLRRPTTSYAATVKFMYEMSYKSWMEWKRESGEAYSIVNTVLYDRSINRSIMIDPSSKLYRESRLVRFEDGKLNPKATFRALAAFLDLPYTESMTVCSKIEGINETGFDTEPVYRTYDEWANKNERYFLEYFLRDVYERYGYSFQVYDGKALNETNAAALISGFDTLNERIRDTWYYYYIRLYHTGEDWEKLPEEEQSRLRELAERQVAQHAAMCRTLVRDVAENTQYFGKDGRPLEYMTPLELDQELLEQPLYH